MSLHAYELTAINGFASGVEALRTSALLAYRGARERDEPIEGPHMLFMAEIEKPNQQQDLDQLESYRRRVLLTKEARKR